MASTRKERRMVCSVRTHCGGQDARLYLTSGVNGAAPEFCWEAGTITPRYEPTAIAEGKLEADSVKDAIVKFRSLLVAEKVIPNKAHAAGYVNPLIVQHFPKPSEADVCALLQPFGRAKLARPAPVPVTAQPVQVHA